MSLILSFSLISLKAQRISKEDWKGLQGKEDTLKLLSYKIVNAPNSQQRQQACGQFIPKLVQALKIRGSFFYPFDSLRQISIQYPQDSSFRIFTWALHQQFGSYRYYGAIQLNSANRQLKLIPLFDNTEFTASPADTVTSNLGWIGCIYYRIIQNAFRGKTYYTLFGWDGDNIRSDQKILDILTFKKGKAIFGAPIFKIRGNQGQPVPIKRFFLVFKKDANVQLNYDDQMKMIVFDHLVSLTQQLQKKYTLVPDGDYEAFKWINGYWVHINNPFDLNPKSPKASFPKPYDFKSNLLNPSHLHH
ncbi:MAG: hypothetical protein ACYCOO_08635 [Chitinophagaceae bacterium]